jgi:hypothetical protein
MQLVQSVLLERAWNSTPDGLGRLIPRARDGSIGEGVVLGPTAVAYANDLVYVFDNAERGRKRLVAYDASGRMISSVPLPGGESWGDLVVNPADSSVFVIDHLVDKIYEVQGDIVTELGPICLRDFPVGLKFGYDEDSGTLYVHDYERGDVPLITAGEPLDLEDRIVRNLEPVTGDLEEQDRHNVLLKLRDGQELRIGFDAPVQCVEETIMDRHGIVWVLYTLEGDFQMRRLARVDPLRHTVGVTSLDVYFPYESTRNMVASGNGVVIVAGNEETARVLSFEYSGSL